MSRFKIGQKVVCVDDKNQGKAIKPVIKGVTYEVKGFNRYFEEGLLFSEATGHSYLGGFWSDRFAPLQEDGSTKALVECIVECIEELKLEEMEMN